MDQRHGKEWWETLLLSFPMLRWILKMQKNLIPGSYFQKKAINYSSRHFMKAKFLTIRKYLFFIVLGGFFVWLSVRNLDRDNWEQIKHAAARGRKWVILPVILFLLIAHFSRAIRWKLLMEPMGYKPSTFNAFAAVMIGYLVNAGAPRLGEDRKSTRLNSSHSQISYAVFCLKKKKYK